MKISFVAAEFGDKKINQSHKYSPDFTTKTGVQFVYENTKKSIDLIFKIFEKNNIDHIKDADAILHITQSPSNSIPNDASIIQDYYGINQNSLCLTINQGCSGFVQAVGLANSLIETYNFKKIIIITNDHYRKSIDQDDRATDALFSDCATITLIESDDKYKIKEFKNYTDGSGHSFLKKDLKTNIIKMNGLKVYDFTKKIVINNLIKKYIDIDSFNDSEFYIHQASAFVLNEIYNLIPKSNCHSNLNKYGNTISSTIPLLLMDNKMSKKNIYFIGFGVGLSASILKLEK
jgi:3-oxoacyl-[acyl-carrier-protein] synthase III